MILTTATKKSTNCSAESLINARHYVRPFGTLLSVPAHSGLRGVILCLFRGTSLRIALTRGKQTGPKIEQEQYSTRLTQNVCNFSSKIAYGVRLSMRVNGRFSQQNV